jgi:hypothetical protein
MNILIQFFYRFPINQTLHSTFSNRNPNERVPDRRELNTPAEQLPACSADFRWGEFPRSRRPRFGQPKMKNQVDVVKKEVFYHQCDIDR